MAYLDWDAKETPRVDEQVKWQIENDPNEGRRRGTASIWKQVEEDLQTEEALLIRGN